MRLFGLFVMLLLISGSAVADDLGAAVREFDQGNALFRRGDYRGALAAYGRVAEEGYVSGPLYYNMGNAFYRIDEIGQAIRYFEKARRFMADRPELIHNLEIARSRTVDEFSRIPDPVWLPIWQGIVRRVGPGGLFAVGVLFYVLFAVLAGRRIVRGPGSWLRRLLTASAAAAVIFVVLGFTASIAGDARVEAIVLPDEVILLSEPNGRQTDLAVHEGLLVHILETRRDWMEVRLPNGATGWMRSESLGEI
jgi:tetratricopeptide (TPR) repeat protein